MTDSDQNPLEDDLREDKFHLLNKTQSERATELISGSAEQTREYNTEQRKRSFKGMAEPSGLSSSSFNEQ